MPPLPHHLVSLLCPHPSPLPVLQFFLPTAFILTSPVSLAVLTLWTESNERQKRTVMMEDTLSFYLCYPVFRLDWIETVFFLSFAAFELIWNLKYYWEYCQDKPSLWVSVIRLIFFSFVWISSLMFNTLQPLPLSYSRFGCVSSLLTLELVNSRFPKVWQGRENN